MRLCDRRRWTITSVSKRASGLNNMNKKLRILGTRGIPANHGGFETFAENLALYLAPRGWDVTVYCQEDGIGKCYESHWRDVRLVYIPVERQGALGTVIFDWKSTLHACRESGLILTLGYNTAIFCVLYRLKGLTNIINMDGIEWRRQKWGPVAKTWFYMNEWAGAWLGNHLIADHPEIKKHLSTRVRAGKITTIPYGSDRIDGAEVGVLSSYNVVPNGYALLIARAEPENSILEVVRAWSLKKRGLILLVLGNYAPNHVYQCAVRDAASDEVRFAGAIYDAKIVSALRFFARLYIHGHQVGGTNPSLVEALGAGNAVLAHDNPFNRWVAGDSAKFFRNGDECEQKLELALHDDEQVASIRTSSLKRHSEAFTWQMSLSAYEALLSSHVPSRQQKCENAPLK